MSELDKLRRTFRRADIPFKDDKAFDEIIFLFGKKKWSARLSEDGLIDLNDLTPDGLAFPIDSLTAQSAMVVCGINFIGGGHAKEIMEHGCFD